jgi:channel protein (hemolysin III family)
MIAVTDAVSAFSHLLIGAPLFAVMTLVLLWRSRGDLARQIVVAIYGLSNLFMFSMSGVYHLLSPETPARMVLQRLDHAAIFLLIAATFTPPHWILFRGTLRWLPLAVVWSAAAIGITLKSIFFDDFSEAVGLTLYLALGWLGALSGFFIWYFYGFGLFLLLLSGAVAYTFGALLDFLRWPVLIPGVLAYHECFHLAVLAGAAFFCSFVYRLASGRPKRVCRPAPPPTVN